MTAESGFLAAVNPAASLIKTGRLAEEEDRRLLGSYLDRERLGDESDADVVDRIGVIDVTQDTGLTVAAIRDHLAVLATEVRS